MKSIRSLAASLFAAVTFVATMGIMAAPAQAQATRTWVSGVGDDVNPCSRTAPCKTFAGAISKTAAGGEIDCLDPAGYGTLTITKSITIDCTGTFGSTLNSGGINGFVINDSATATPGTIEVILRGVSINGAGTTPGLNGVRFISGKSLTMQDVLIQNQNSGAGISIAPNAANAEVHLNRVTIADSQHGIMIQPSGTAGSARVFLNEVSVFNSTSNGIGIDTSAATSSSGVLLNINDSEVSGNFYGIAIVAPAGKSATDVLVNGTAVFNNGGSGILGNGTGARIRVANTTISGNALGVNPGGSSLINDFGHNILVGNTNNGTFN